MNHQSKEGSDVFKTIDTQSNEQKPFKSGAGASGRVRWFAAGKYVGREASGLLFDWGACVSSNGRDTPGVQAAPGPRA
ncbi:hypothetical protein [Alcaligenes sp. SDU_A2]|uniref:hypothetical protein n=1 Tax=Alcaligenes sp. SDU_A2 TaxID=3136634 RepID=UPI00311F0D6D